MGETNDTHYQYSDTFGNRNTAKIAVIASKGILATWPGSQSEVGDDR